MSDSIAVEFKGVGKMYRLYKSRADSFLDVTGLSRLAPWWQPHVDHFWALRDVGLKLGKGTRLGIIGRNGAGKTTLLKLMTGNLAPTEGQIKVQGQVQALLDAGAGFHPEFSGYENIEASLIHYGLNRTAIAQAVEEIADFTELQEFLNQPFKTYSAGMQARLAFTTATTIKPDILIIDEILGAGDAYFAAKSRMRMKQLVEGGASVLLVTHALDYILQFCEEAIWLERGRVVARGPSLEVVRAYEEFIHALQDRRLMVSNRRRRMGFRDAVNVGEFADSFVVALTLHGTPGSRLDVTKVELRGNGVAEETLRVGDVQDSEASHLACVALSTGQWGDPRAEEKITFRSLEVGPEGHAQGEMVFRSFGLEPKKLYSFHFQYRSKGDVRIVVTIGRNGHVAVGGASLPAGPWEWQEQDVLLEPMPTPGHDGKPSAPSDHADADTVLLGSAKQVRRWTGEGALSIDDVMLLNAEGSERAVFTAGAAMTLSIGFQARTDGHFPLICSVAIFRTDGVKVTQHVSPQEILAMGVGERREFRLRFPSMDLADGRYVISVALHRSLDPRLPNETEWYDLVDRSYEFEIAGNLPLRTSLIVLPACWDFDRPCVVNLATGAIEGRPPSSQPGRSSVEP